MKAQLTAFLSQLMLHDYLLFGGVLLLFLLFLVLTILLRHRLFLSMVCLVIALAVLIAGPTYGYVQLNAFLFKNAVTATEIKALEFSDALLVHGSVQNLSKRDFRQCTVTAEVYKVAGNPVLDLLFPLNPFQKGTILTGPVGKGETADFKIFVEPFHYSKEYNVSIGASCR